MSDMRIIGIRPLPKPEKRPSPLAAMVLWAIAALGLLASSLCAPGIYAALSGLNPHVQLLIVNLAYYLPFVALPVFLLAKRTPGLYEAYRPNPISLFSAISIVILAVLGVFLVNDITVLWSIPFEELGWNVYSAGIPVARNTRELMLSVFIVAVIPAVCEEFLFRGVVFSAFESRGTRHAMFISGILFMLIHAAFLGAPGQLLLGVVLAFIVFWTDSIYAGLMYHTVHNATVVILQYQQARWTAAGEAAESMTLLQAIGGWPGIPELLFNIGLSLVLVWFTLKLMRLRGQLRGIIAEPRKKAGLRPAAWAAAAGGALCCGVLYIFDFIAMLGG